MHKRCLNMVSRVFARLPEETRKIVLGFLCPFWRIPQKLDGMVKVWTSQQAHSSAQAPEFVVSLVRELSSSFAAMLDLVHSKISLEPFLETGRPQEVADTVAEDIAPTDSDWMLTGLIESAESAESTLKGLSALQNFQRVFFSRSQVSRTCSMLLIVLLRRHESSDSTWCATRKELRCLAHAAKKVAREYSKLAIDDVPVFCSD